VLFCLQEAKRGLSASAVFIARNRFAVLDKASGQIQVRRQYSMSCLSCYVLLSVACAATLSGLTL
jgi:hypothetical protein